MPEENKSESRSSESRDGSVSRAAAVTGFIIVFVVTAAAFALRPVPKAQPVAFNHQLHVVDNGLSCSDCHEFYSTETFSGLPEAETCGFCHLDGEEGSTAEEKKLIQLLEEGAPLKWTPLFVQPSHVFYSHRRHVEVAKLDCSVCHGQIAESKSPPRWVRQLTMDDCINCHEQQNARTDCTTCHR